MKSMLPQKSPVSPLVYSTGILSFFQAFQLIPSISPFFNHPSIIPKPPQELKPLIFCTHTQPVSHITTRQLIIHGESSVCVCVIHGFSYLPQLFFYSLQ